MDEILDIYYRYLVSREKSDKVNRVANLLLARVPNYNNNPVVIGGLRWTPPDKNGETRVRSDLRLQAHNLRSLYATYSYDLYAPRRFQELAWIQKQLGHHSKENLLTAARYNSRKVESGIDLIKPDPLKLKVEIHVMTLLQNLIDLVGTGKIERQSNVTAKELGIEKETVQELKVQISSLHQQLNDKGKQSDKVFRKTLNVPLVEMQTKTKTKNSGIFFEVFLVDGTITPYYKEAQSAEDIKTPFARLIQRMTLAHVVKSVPNFRLLGYSKAQAYRLAQKFTRKRKQRDEDEDLDNKVEIQSERKTSRLK